MGRYFRLEEDGLGSLMLGGSARSGFAGKGRRLVGAWCVQTSVTVGWISMALTEMVLAWVGSCDAGEDRLMTGCMGTARLVWVPVGKNGSSRC